MKKCIIRITVNRPEYLLTNFTWDSTTNRLTLVKKDNSEEPLKLFTGDCKVWFREKHPGETYKYYKTYEEAKKDENNRGFTLVNHFASGAPTIRLCKPIKIPATVSLKRLQIVEIDETMINIATGEIRLGRELISESIVYYRKTNLGVGELTL